MISFAWFKTHVYNYAFFLISNLGIFSSSLVRFLRDNLWLILLMQPVLLLISETVWKILFRFFNNCCLRPCSALFLCVVSEVPLCTSAGGSKGTSVAVTDWERVLRSFSFLPLNLPSINHTCNPSTQEAELETANWPIKRQAQIVQNQPRHEVSGAETLRWYLLFLLIRLTLK